MFVFELSCVLVVLWAPPAANAPTSEAPQLSWRRFAHRELRLMPDPRKLDPIPGRPNISRPLAPFLTLAQGRWGTLSLSGGSQAGCSELSLCNATADAILALAWQLPSLPISIFGGLHVSNVPSPNEHGTIRSTTNAGGFIGIYGWLPNLLERGGRLELDWGH